MKAMSSHRTPKGRLAGSGRFWPVLAAMGGQQAGVRNARPRAARIESVSKRRFW
jgi:hypothetical protein